jgi:hypothetical protein
MTLPYENATSGEKALAGRGHGPGSRTHGQASTNGWSHKYRAWAGMVGRVRDTKSPRSRWYTDVPIHPAWLVFEVFDADVPDPPSRVHTLDRVRGELGYVPGNVRWATMKEQARNRRSNRLVTIGDRTQCIAAWAEETGIGEATLRYRLRRGVSLLAPVRALRKPSGKTVLEHVEQNKMPPQLEGPKA